LTAQVVLGAGFSQTRSPLSSKHLNVHSPPITKRLRSGLSASDLAVSLESIFNFLSPSIGEGPFFHPRTSKPSIMGAPKSLSESMASLIDFEERSITRGLVPPRLGVKRTLLPSVETANLLPRLS